MIRKWQLTGGIVVISAALLAGCATVTDAVVDGAAEGLSRAASERAANAVYKRLAPKEQLPQPKTPGWNQFMAQQAQIMFGYAFAPGGVWISQRGYQPGDYTKFELNQPDDDSKVVLERAYLEQLDNGNQWWRISWSEEEESWIYEGLISPSESSLIRLRAKDADGNEGEVPVSGQTIYTEPAELTEESIEGATVGEESISTPAGTFRTDHVRYMPVTGEGTLDWWLTDQVPGGVARYQLSSEEDGVIWTITVSEKGNDATTVLDSF